MSHTFDPSAGEPPRTSRSRRSDRRPKADLIRRFAAALLDGLVAALIDLAVPVLGRLLGAAYILFKDALPYEITRNPVYAHQSIGKRAMGLEVAVLQGRSPMSWGRSALRNWPLAIGTLLAAIPLAGWALGPLLGSLLGLAEFLLVVVDPDGRRLGDRVAETQVVPSRRGRSLA